MRSTHRFAIICVLPFLAGCYTYAPVQSPQPGMEVRARLLAEAAARRSQGMADPILSYDGVIVDVTPDTLSLDVLVARSTSAFQDVVIRDTVTIGNAEIQSIMRRKLSPTRSMLFTVAAGAAAFAIVQGIDAVVGGTGDPGDDGTPTLRIPLFGLTGWRPIPALVTARDE